jgi:flagellar M-ring protein FliF
MKSIGKRTVEFFQNIEKKKLILIITLAAVVVIAGIVGAVLLNQVHYTVLYSGLEASEAGTIKTLLDGKGVQSKVQGTSTILVPEDQADNLRIELASEGYPSTGLNYDIFSGSSAIGSTDLERRTYYQFQLQENIRQTLRHMEKVQDCIVLVNLASDSSFVVSDNKTEASVAVQLSLKNGETLTNSEANTIHKLVLKAVPDLKPENISIVDSKMKYYDVTEEDEAGAAADYTASQQQMTEQMKDILQKQALRVLEPAVGNENVAVSVNLSLNFDKQTVSKVEFSPPVEGETNGLIRSSEEISNAVGAGAANAGGEAGADSNGSGNPAYVTEASPAPSAASGQESSTKTYNYELNEIQTQIEKAQGAVQNLSVAVLVNSNIQGMEAYVGNIRNLVAQSIGVKPDYISVELMPFVDTNSMQDSFQQNQQAIQKLASNKLITTIITAAAVLAAIIVIARLFFGKRPARVLAPEAAAAGAAGVGVGQAVAIMPGDFDEAEPVEEYDLTNLVLKKSTEAEKIEELMDRYPETVAQILRQWLAEDN